MSISESYGPICYGKAWALCIVPIGYRQVIVLYLNFYPIKGYIEHNNVSSV